MNELQVNPELELEQVNTMIELAREYKDTIKREIQKLQEMLIQKDIEIRDLRQSIPAIEYKIKLEKTKKLLYKEEISGIKEAKEILKQYEPEYSHAKEIYTKVTKAKKVLEELGADVNV